MFTPFPSTHASQRKTLRGWLDSPPKKSSVQTTDRDRGPWLRRLPLRWLPHRSRCRLRKVYSPSSPEPSYSPLSNLNSPRFASSLQRRSKSRAQRIVRSNHLIPCTPSRERKRNTMPAQVPLLCTSKLNRRRAAIESADGVSYSPIEKSFHQRCTVSHATRVAAESLQNAKPTIHTGGKRHSWGSASVACV